MRDLLITMPRPAAELPARFPHPLAGHRPHAVAAEAASVLMRELEDGISARASAAAAEQEGKMFGVLVVRDHNGRIGFLAGFSGMLAGRWRVPGFVPPLFDLTARDGFWPRGQARLAELEAALTQLQTESAPLSHKLVELRERHADELAQLRAHHRERKRERARRRQALARDDPRHRELAHQSSGDRRERRQLRSSHAAAEARLVAELDALGEQITELRTQRSAESNRLLGLIHDLYRPADASGGAVDLRAAYAPGSPPGGAGDCAAPKLLGYGNRHGLEPIALAEFWWGPPPSTGGRHHGLFYPPCRGKCGPLLPLLLRGIEIDDPPIWSSDEVGLDQPTIRYQDRWLMVVDKPAGLLSVPGRGPALRDSVEHRLRERFPDELPTAAHRLDLDTSGLMLVARDPDTYTALQQQFANRRVDKLYIAWVDGDVVGERGQVDLPLRVDLDDRPRQIVDPIHGKAATTDWRVVERRGGRTRVELIPTTGRTHQLRVHAAHPQGIGRAIVGDRLYGFSGPRMMLHAESLELIHPRTGALLRVESPAPF